jgi:hypothetical protein
MQAVDRRGVSAFRRGATDALSVDAGVSARCEEETMTLGRIAIGFVGVVTLVAGAPPAEARFAPHLAITLGMGIADFTRGPVRNITSPSGALDVRLTVGTRTPLAFEAQYRGTLGHEHDPFALEDPMLVTTQLTGSARFNFTTRRVQPFFVGGLGWINLHSFGRDQAPVAAATFAHDGNGLVVPLGLGLAGYLGAHGLLEARATYNFVTGANHFTIAGARPDMWTVVLSGGYVF